jgi:hypothetical protein
MNIKGRGLLLAVSALGLILAGAGPAFAQHGGGGGGGGHSGGGGGHASGGGGGHAAVGHAGGGAHFAGGAHYGGGYAGGAHFAGGYHGGYAGRAGFAGHGYSTGWRGGSFGGGWRGAGWRGGYWRGGFWPRAFYGGGFAWFLPILPLAYATYWYGGIPYYYANDVYYTWNPTYDGYVATDPPPVADSSGSADVSGSGPAPSGDAGAQDSGPGPGGPVAGQIFMYPKNGQSAEQQASDKAECQRWASEQAGQVAQNGSDYNRAMVACVEGRGYSAR